METEYLHHTRGDSVQCPAVRARAPTVPISSFALELTMKSPLRFAHSSWIARGVLATLVAAPASATVHTLVATMKGVEEVPPNTSLALGTATVLVDDVANTVTVTGNYSGLASAATLCHLHGSAILGVSASPIVDLTVSGGTSGTISSGGPVTPAQVQDILNGLTYVNVHNANFPNGEIRGQVLAEPTGTAYFCFGDGTTTTTCPCVAPNTVPSPAGATAHGCANSFDLNGALLKVAGTTAPDTLFFLADLGTNYSGFAVLVASNTSDPAGAVAGDGVLCVNGSMVRFGEHNAGTEGAPVGLWTYPSTAQTTPVSVITGQTPATTASYQLMYRNAVASFCTPDTFNVTNGVQILWP
jgi:hypothetical protein